MTDMRHGRPGDIDVTLPLRPASASMLRVIAAAVGADAGCLVEEIDDVRLGLNEAFSLLVAAGAGDRVRTRFRLDGGSLVVLLVPDGGDASVEPDELAMTILRSVLDGVDLSPDGIVLRKRVHIAADG